MLVGPIRLKPVLWYARWELATFTVAGVVAGILHDAHMRPDAWGAFGELLRNVEYGFALPSSGSFMTAVSALGTALAIFLSFRNGAAYDRWWEARKIWGGLVNDSRSWTRQVLSWVGASGADEDRVKALQQELVHRHLAFVWGLAYSLRRLPEVHTVVAPFLPEDERAVMQAKPNLTTALLIQQGQRLSEIEDEGLLTHLRHLEMDDLLTRLSDIQGKCERIKNTPLPRQYEAIPRTFVRVYGCMLPFGLAPSLGWLCLPLGLLIGLLFDLLENSGRVIEDPFENDAFDTPMFALATTIERDLRAALGEPLPPGAQPDEAGVLM